MLKRCHDASDSMFWPEFGLRADWCVCGGFRQAAWMNGLRNADLGMLDRCLSLISVAVGSLGVVFVEMLESELLASCVWSVVNSMAMWKGGDGQNIDR